LRQGWPAREGVSMTRVRKLSNTEADRNTRLWTKLETDPEYRALARSIWSEDFAPHGAAEQAEMQHAFDEQIARAAKVVAKLRARGVPIVFVRPPSSGAYLTYENRDFPRSRT